MDYEHLKELLNMGYSLNRIAKETNKSLTSVRYWAKKHNLPSLFMNFGQIPPKIHKCKCGETDPSKFYGHKVGVCGACHSAYTLNRGKDFREKVISFMGGCCVACGYNKYACSLDVHHLNPSEKDPKFSGHRGWKWERVVKEVQGCVLLCKNCHSALHSGFISLPENTKPG